MIQGEFLETSSEGKELFGLSSMALEQIACQGLACVVHMNLQVCVHKCHSKTSMLSAVGSVVFKKYSL